jgi:uncharacterized protein (TIGR03435 family)
MKLAAAAIMPVVIGVMISTGARAQGTKPVATTKFEAVSIKPCAASNPGGEGGPAGPNSDIRMTISCWSLDALIDTAYIVFAGGRFNGNNGRTPIEGLPGWATSQAFTIEARAEGTPGPFMMRGPMLQKLLENRFALKLHSATKLDSAYALTVAKSGLKLKRFEGNCTPLNPIFPPDGPIKNPCPRNPHDTIANLDIFAWILSNVKPRILDAPVINKTGVAGLFHFNMEAITAQAVGDPLFASLFNAVQDFGLKLEATKAPRLYFIVDHVERPSAN